MASDLILDPSDCSAYIMRPGTQQFFRHRVRRNKRIHKDRLSFSFRAFVPEAERIKPIPLIYSTPDTRTNNAPHSATPITLLPIKSNGNTPPVAALFHAPSSESNKVSPDQQKTSDGYSPFPPKSVSFHSSTTTHPSTEANKKLCLILGSSITLDISGQLLSRGNRRVINCSETGANLRDVCRMAKDFHFENPNSILNVDQIILNVGTNDIKYFNGRDRNVFKHFKPLVIDLVKSLKFMFPRALMVFQSVLPIKIIYNYTAQSVDLFNQLLLSVCENFGCIFYDCFNDFIKGWDYDSDVYRDKFHLNDKGIILLARHFKCIIYGNIFNPYPRLTYHHDHFKKYY